MRFSLTSSFIITVFAFLLTLGLVVIVHELGHFLFCKLFGIYVKTFSIGIGPKFLRKRWGETEYVLSAIPFGGYVKMLGQDDMDPSQLSSEQIAANPRSYSAKSVPQRMAIIS
jgi:regulator of sigma E protease